MGGPFLATGSLWVSFNGHWLTTVLVTALSRVHISMHWITLTGFVLAPPPVLGLSWRHLYVL